MSGAGPVAGGKNAPLEGLRAVAIFLVLFYHAGAPGVSVGWLGVDLFFVLSGFLITTILLREYARTDRVALGNFWHRRILRLVPAYAVYAILMTTLLLMAAPTPEGSYAPADLVTAIWTYTVNYLPLGGITERQYLTRHLWSLSLEWQYYLVFPLLLVGMLRAGRWWIPFAFILGVIVLDAAVDLPGHPRLTMNGRGVSLLIGSATAYYLFNFQDALQPWFARLHVPAIVIAIACFARLEAAHTGEIAGSVTILLLFWTACAIVIGSYWYGASSFGAALLSIPAIVFIGQISYGMYLWHMIGWEIVWVHLDPAWFDGWNRFVAYGTKLTLYVSFAVIAATASFYMVERPFLALKRRPVAAARPAGAPMTLTGLVVRYAAFAVAATVANLATQRLVLAVDDGPAGFVAAMLLGTLVGLVLKYALDKRWIFDDRSTGAAAHGRKFTLYTLMGVVTTAIFWGTETAFWLIWHTDLARETGAVLGLAVGYVVKYRLDRRFVFTDATLRLA